VIVPVLAMLAAFSTGEAPAAPAVASAQASLLVERSVVRDRVDHDGTLVRVIRSGKQALFGWFVGQVMKSTGGKANPAAVNEILKRKLAG